MRPPLKPAGKFLLRAFPKVLSAYLAGVAYEQGRKLGKKVEADYDEISLRLASRLAQASNHNGRGSE